MPRTISHVYDKFRLSELQITPDGAGRYGITISGNLVAQDGTSRPVRSAGWTGLTATQRQNVEDAVTVLVRRLVADELAVADGTITVSGSEFVG